MVSESVEDSSESFSGAPEAMRVPGAVGAAEPGGAFLLTETPVGFASSAGSGFSASSSSTKGAAGPAAISRYAKYWLSESRRDFFGSRCLSTVAWAAEFTSSVLMS